MSVSSPRRCPSLLIVDDEPGVLTAYARLLRHTELDVATCDGPHAAIERTRSTPFDVALVDVRMPDGSGLDLLRHFRRYAPSMTVVMMSAAVTVEEAFEARKLGAHALLPKPIAPDVLRQQIAHAIAAQVSSTPDNDGIIGESLAARALQLQIDEAASSECSVVIMGETGTGKELVARAIHRRSRRTAGPFVDVNCGGGVESLREADLFGALAGAYTGAVKRNGLFATARNGTLFLDELGEMSSNMQSSLLRVLETGEVRPVGADRSERVNVRVIGATHVDLRQAVSRARFREDLYYRMSVLEVRVPPLRDRREDIQPLANRMLRLAASRDGKSIHDIAPEVLEYLTQQSWPGNVRGLRNAIDSAVARCRGDRLELVNFGVNSPMIARSDAPPARTPAEPQRYREAKRDVVQAFDQTYFATLLARTAGNITQAAKLAGMERKHFARSAVRAGVELRPRE
jgi:two-component system response regulator GlrR